MAGGHTSFQITLGPSHAGWRLDRALALAPQSVDLSSRLDTRISMLRDEIATKREMLGA